MCVRRTDLDGGGVEKKEDAAMSKGKKRCGEGHDSWRTEVPKTNCVIIFARLISAV